MESTAEYASRKRRELTFLAACAGEHPGDFLGPDAGVIVEAKRALRARQQARAIADHPELTETSLHGRRSQSWFGYDLSYRYQRFDLEVTSPPLPYPGRAAAGCVTRFFSSGMGAIAAVLLGLDRTLTDAVTVLALEDVYFETQQLVHRLTNRLSLARASDEAELVRAASHPAARVALIDSIVASGPSRLLERIEPGALDLVILDSTCYELASPWTSAVVEAAAALRVPLVLVRSHLKLDALGVEWGRLGSAVFVARPDAGPGDARFLEALLTACQDTARVLGLHPLPQQLPPHLFDQRFHQLNDMRLARIRANTRWIGDEVRRAVDGTAAHVVQHHHDLFFTLELDRAAGRPQVQEWVRELVALARAAGLAAHEATSFGYDDIAIAEFVDLQRDAHVLRIAPSDGPSQSARGLADVVAAFAVRALSARTAPVTSGR
jgi:hypothetical protein